MPLRWQYPVREIKEQGKAFLKYLWSTDKKGVLGVRKLGKWLMLGLLSLSFVGLKYGGIFQPLELSIYDHWWRKAPIESPDSRIVIVGFDETDLTDYFGQYPPSNEQLADVIEQIEAQKPAVIGFDIIRDLKVEGRLAEIFRTSNIYGVGDHQSFNFPAILKERNQVGTAGVPTEPNGGFGWMRRAQIFGSTQSKVAHLGLELVGNYLSQKGEMKATMKQDGLWINGKRIPLFRGTDGGYSLKEVGGFNIFMRWRKGNFSMERWEDRFPSVTARDLAQGQVAPDFFTGKIVLMGYRPSSVRDVFITPIGYRYGVDVVAQVTSQLLSYLEDERPLMRGIPEGVEYALLLLCVALGYVQSRFLKYQSILREACRQGAMILAIALGLYYGGYLFFLRGMWIPVGQLLAAYLVSVVIWGFGSYLVHFQKLSQNLEREVAKRTQDLEKSHEKLKKKTEEIEKMQQINIINAKQVTLARLSNALTHDLKTYFGILEGSRQRLPIILKQKSEDLMEEELELMEETIEELSLIFQKLGGIYTDTDWGKPMPFELQDLLLEIFQEKGIALLMRQVELNLEVESRTVYLPRLLVREMLRNLIINALESLKNQEPKVLKIQGKIENDNEKKLQMTIADTGTGMSPEIISQIYDPFFTTKSEGWGFGLYFVWQTMSYLKGSIEVSSSEGKGSTFSLTLPLTEKEN